VTREATTDAFEGATTTGLREKGEARERMQQGSW